MCLQGSSRSLKYGHVHSYTGPSSSGSHCTSTLYVVLPWTLAVTACGVTWRILTARRRKYSRPRDLTPSKKSGEYSLSCAADVRPIHVPPHSVAGAVVTCAVTGSYSDRPPPPRSRTSVCPKRRANRHYTMAAALAQSGRNTG